MTAVTCEVNELHFREGTSDKFYRIYKLGTRVHVQYGKRGTGGQWSTKDFPSTFQADDFATRQYYEKTGKGYQDTGSATFATDTTATTFELHRLFDQNRVATGNMPLPTSVTGKAAEREAKEMDKFKEELLKMRKSLDTKSEGEPGQTDLETQLAQALQNVRSQA